MIPYVPSVLFRSGGIELHWFSFLVLLAIVLGDLITVRQGQRLSLDPRAVRYLDLRIVVGGLLLAHFLDGLFYYPGRIWNDPLSLFSNWAGLSSFGGFFGAALVLLWFNRQERIVPLLPYADAVALGLAPAWAIARVGCFTAHDHPGAHTNFLLAVRYPDGPRHDLGLDEAIATVAIAVALYLFARLRPGPGAIIGLGAVLYALVRFPLDFLRATDVAGADPRYLGLTPGQWASFACLAAGVRLLHRSSRR